MASGSPINQILNIKFMPIDIATPEGATLTRNLLNGSENFFAEVDENGNINVHGVIIRVLSDAELGTIPELGELVAFESYAGMTAIGDGSKTARQLDWIGTYRLRVGVDYITSRVTPSETLKFFENTGIRKAIVTVFENITYPDSESYFPLAAAFEFPFGMDIRVTFPGQDSYPLIKITGSSLSNLDGTDIGESLLFLTGFDGNAVFEAVPGSEAVSIVTIAPNSNIF